MKKKGYNSIQVQSSLRIFRRVSIALYLFVAYSLSNPVVTYGQEVFSDFVPVAPEILSNSHVRCFYKDSKGYMWIGTEDALIRYDGRNAFRYTNDPNNSSTIAHNTINTIIESYNKQLWIGTAQGLCIYDRELDNFINVDSIKGNQNYLNNRYITDLEFDTMGRLWIGTHEGGINIYDPVKREFDYIVDPPQGGILPSSNFINILVNINDTIWSASKGGLLLYDIYTKERLPLNFLDRFSNAQISSIVNEKPGNILVATTPGEITRITQGKQPLFEKILTGEELGEGSNGVLALAYDGKGNILTGGENSGLNIINEKTGKVNRLLAEDGKVKGLPTNSIESIYVDDHGLIWIGTFSNGAFLLDNSRKKFKTTETSAVDLALESNEVRGFAEDSQKNIWLASYGRGISRINSGINTLVNVPEINERISNKNINTIIFDRQGELWLGTTGKGVYRFNPKTNKIINYSVVSEGFGNNQVFCLYEDKLGTIWAGTWGSGLFFFDPINNNFKSATEYEQPGHIPNTAYVSEILEDSEGTLWVGTLFGLYELQRRTKYASSFTYRVHLPDTHNGSIKGAQIQAIVEDKNNNLWVGTTDGLNLKKKGSSQFEVYQMRKGTFANMIRSLLIDKGGNVWIGGNHGLSKLGQKDTSIINYTREDGLKSNNFVRKAALASSTGKLYFGNNNGFDSFYPDSLDTASPVGTLVLSDLKINNQSVKPGIVNSPLKKHISLTSELNLSYDQRSFVIDFVALDHGQAPNYTYCYKLEGFDIDWNCMRAHYSATYTNIDPGKYTFLVKAANRDGIWVDEPLTLEITIRQVFWKTWWAYTSYICVLMFIIIFLVKIRIERLKLKNEIMLEKLRREQEQKLSESKTHFFTNVAHEFRTPLSLIMIPLESLMGTNDIPAVFRTRIYTAFKNALRMKRLVNEFLDFNKLEAGNLKLNVHHGELVQFIEDTSSFFNEMAAKREILFSVSSDTPIIMGWFDREKLEQMIFNLLSNAFKFTADKGEIKLRISVKHSVISNGKLSRCLELVIEDNGVGISPEELPHIFEKFYQAKSSSKILSSGTGIGLSLTKALVELHYGTIRVTSVLDQATVFTILLPIDASVYQIEETVMTPPEVIHIRKHPDENLAPTVQEHPNSDNQTEKPTILLAEDNPDLREYLVAELQSEFIVLEAKDGAEGLTTALDKNPDLIISDIMMPVKDGIEFCNAIKSDLNTSHIPFILLTAKATVEDQIIGVNTGADLYISKPFNIRYLVAHIHQIIASRRQLYARFSQDVYLMPAKATNNALDQEFLQKAVDYVIGNLQHSQLSVDSIAAIFNLSRMQVYRKIKALTGKSVVEFIRMVRMKQALKLMDSHRLTLSEIAFEVGFNSASYFTRCFKEEFGKTPSEYLEQS